MKINNVEVYGLDKAVKASKYPMAVDLDKLDESITPTAIKLAQAEKGSGHDNFLNGIVVQFDLTFTVKAWVELQRYHFIDFVSSQSTMHRITKFNLDESYCEYVDQRIIEIMKYKVDLYNTLEAKNKANPSSEMNEVLKRMYLEILYSNPCGFELTARMTTNYRQLKTIYSQRKNHRLPEWREFCEWIETLPHSEFITGETDESKRICFVSW